MLTFVGDSSAVQDELKDWKQIQASHSGFAAVPVHGWVGTWGDADSGGDQLIGDNTLINSSDINRLEREGSTK